MSYVNNQLIECMRATSTEKTSGNNNEVAQFTNKLNQSVILNVGDQISIERAFINGLGAGNQNTIQFSGRKQQAERNRTQKYTEIIPNNFQDNTRISPYRMGYYLGYEVQEKKNEISTIKDNESSITVGYYINSCNHPSYVQLPRRFASRYYGTSSIRGDWTESDTSDSGLPLAGQSVDPLAFCLADFKYYRTGDADYIKQKVDNSRFTLYLKEKVFYAWETTDSRYAPPVVTPIEGRDVVSGNEYLVSWAKYHRYREKKTINVDKGFNSPESIADQIHQQLNQSEAPETFNVQDPIDILTKHPITTTMKAETYKPFNVANINDFSSLYWDDFSRWETLGGSNNVVRYESSFYALGVKRPEIWDAGRDVDDLSTTFNPIHRSISVSQRGSANITIDKEWTIENLTYFKNIFLAQKLYPELWDDLDKLPDYENYSSQQLFRLRPNTSAFLHMSRFESASLLADLPKVPTPIGYWGQDGLGRVPNATQTATAPIFFEYDETQKDKYISSDGFTPSIETDWNIDDRVFGFAIPWYDATAQKYKIAVSIKKSAPIPFSFFTGTTPASGGNPAIPNSKIWGSEDLASSNAGRWIGYDWSFTAYGSACILPYNPAHETSFEGTQNGGSYYHYNTGLIATNEATVINTTIYNTQAYIGANNPILSFNNDTNKFEFSQLHLAENLGNSYDAGDMNSGKIISPPINPDAGDIVYKINPRVDYFGYSPTFKPYKVDVPIQYADPDGANSIAGLSNWTLPLKQDELLLGSQLNQRDISVANDHIEPYKIFDAWGGIYLDDMGYNIEEWDEKSLWGRLGFSWEQFNSPSEIENMLNQRISQKNRYSLYRPTTNAEVDTTDTKAFVVNIYGAPMYSNTIGMCSVINPKKWTHPSSGPVYPHCTWGTEEGFTYYPALTQKTNSLTLPARNLPKIQLNPFYTIRSNIIGYTEYLGSAEGGMRLSVVGIVDRYGAQGDFFYGSPSDITFTVTKQTIISDIETEICNPDGSLAEVDPDCGVIYRIQRNMPSPQNIIEEIIEQTQKKK